MADVFFKRGTAAEIAAVPVTDGYILWDTSNNIIYMDNGTKRHVFAVGGVDGVRPVEYGGTGVCDAATIASSLKLETLDVSAVTIAENANLNSYITPGVYTCVSADIAATLSNTPFTSGAFVLIVRRVVDSTTVIQTIEGCCTTAKCNSYNRAYDSGSFGEWLAGGGGTKDASELETGTLSTDRLPIVPISKGGTGANTKLAAREALGFHYCESDPGTYIAGDFYFIVGGAG